MTRRSISSVLVVLAGLVTVGAVGCAPGPAASPRTGGAETATPPATAAGPTVPDEPTTTPSSAPRDDAADVRALGDTLPGSIRHLVSGNADVATQVDEAVGWSASYQVTGQVTGPADPADEAAATGEGAVVALFAAPTGSMFEVLADGSAVVRDADGIATAGLGAPSSSDPAVARAHWTVRDADLVVLTVRLLESAAPTPGPGADHPVVEVVVTVSDRAVKSLDWGEREGGRSLAVVPTDWTRAAGEAGAQLAWAQVTAAEPEADVPGMQDQLVCHAVGAPDKAAWNLEPWRPDVGLLDTMLARCNP